MEDQDNHMLMTEDNISQTGIFQDQMVHLLQRIGWHRQQGVQVEEREK